MSQSSYYEEPINFTEIKVIILLIKIDDQANKLFISDDLSEQERVNLILKKGHNSLKIGVNKIKIIQIFIY
jgi:hypothetical protein